MTSWQHLSTEDWHRRLQGAGLSGSLVEGLAVFLTLLARWSQATNLVGNVDEEALLRCHVLESLAGRQWLPEAGRLLDVGSGGGFPAVPLLLAAPQLEGVLLEPRERRWAFLREAARELGLALDVRREALGQHGGAGYAVATVRGLAVEEWRLEVPRVLAEGGRLLWWREGNGPEPLEMAGMRPVITSCLPVAERGEVSIWERCFT